MNIEKKHRASLGKYSIEVSVLEIIAENVSQIQITARTVSPRSWSEKNSMRKKIMPAIIGTKMSDSEMCTIMSERIGLPCLRARRMECVKRSIFL